MSSTMRETSRLAEASINGIVRRMVNLPRSILGGFSRVMNGGRRNRTLPSSYQYQILQQDTPYVPEEWSFLTSFQYQYGSMHPFFYACRFAEALKIAEDDHKFLFLYLHSPDHPFTPSFCEDTLCSELVVQFLDANFICWGALANRGEGLQMAITLGATSFPFCAVIAPAPGESITVLQQLEGPLSPADLVEILQRTLEEQGSAFGSSKLKREEKIKADRRIREEQDKAYLAALKQDKERERLKNPPLVLPKKAMDERLKQNSPIKQQGRVKETTFTRETPNKDPANKGKDSHPSSQILIRFPNGEKRERRFSSMDKVNSIYSYVDSLGLPGTENYRLIASFPRRVYGTDEMNMTLKDAGLHPRASLFLECQ
ncbi:plant UBX domain-containing protein 10-like [Cucumis melo var. makuwa]|uniref:Plant UBX domain-containing protein 10-like n=1 Tax=Cucumis melo var. makuwa TaxID=1194695 RepID=A0A5D3BKC0_CUCMM|nr:plant UBX domain-containing protein 10-like [Cucumis melo var. makuwa]